MEYFVRGDAADTRLTADGSEDLEGHVSDLFHAERQEVVLSEELEGAETQQLEHDADVTFVVEPVQHPDAKVLPVGVLKIGWGLVNVI